MNTGYPITDVQDASRSWKFWKIFRNKVSSVNINEVSVTRVLIYIISITALVDVINDFDLLMKHKTLLKKDTRD